MQVVESSAGLGRLGIVVKRVKGKPYVYEQYRKDGIVVTKYIGPLEEMVWVY